MARRGLEAVRHAFGLLWDGDPHVPKDVLAERLTHLEMLYASPDYTGPRAPRVPPVLLVAATGERGMRQKSELAVVRSHRVGYPSPFIRVHGGGNDGLPVL